MPTEPVPSTVFTTSVTDHWLPPAAAAVGRVRVVVDPGLPGGRALGVLTTLDGRGVLATTPARAEHLGLRDGDDVTPEEVEAALRAAGVVLNDPDHVFHLPAAEHEAVRAETADGGTGPLGADDAETFADLVARAPADDVDEAFVELDHWLVVGTRVDGALASVASALPWSGSPLADVGVLTLPGHRGQGLGRRTVRALCAQVLAHGREPLYRCQLDNTASVALARAAGLAAFGTWRVLDA